jgi:hypothetical protein
VELHKSEVLKLEEKLDEVNGNFECEKAKREILKPSMIEFDEMLKSFGHLRNSAFLLLLTGTGS